LSPDFSRFLKGKAATPESQEAKTMWQERLIRPSEVARLLGVSRSTVYRWFWEGKLQGIKVGHRSVRIAREAVEKILSLCW